jgi:hypothetical protein
LAKIHIKQVENLQLLPASEYWSISPNSSYAHMPCEQWDEIQRDFTAVFDGKWTNVQVGNPSVHSTHLYVQFIVVPEIRRVEGRNPSKRCSDMEGSEFAMHVLESFDLDIARHAIHANNYISCCGGVETFKAFCDKDYLQHLELNTLVWSERSWRPMTDGEKHLKRMDTKARAMKYIARCSNY